MKKIFINLTRKIKKNKNKIIRSKTFLKCLDLTFVCCVYFIIVCKKQTYGVACSQACGYCSNGEACHPANGTCVNGCMEGMMGSNCKIGELK